MKLESKVFMPGGSGTIGRAILDRAKREEWDAEFTIFSRDPVKQHKIKADFPDTRFVLGDICDYGQLASAMMGHDIVLHCAAAKFIPECERDPSYAYAVNVGGVSNALEAAVSCMVKQIILISTDKSCHSVNSYGATKFMGERLFQQYSEMDYPKTTFHIVRYGNVIGSTGSVAQVWRQMLEDEGKVYATAPDMTRFWLTPDEAVSWILMSLDRPSGTITIPQLKSLSMKHFAKYVLPDGTEVEYMGLRPGEKRHEELLTVEESTRAVHLVHPDCRVKFWDLYPPEYEMDDEPTFFDSQMADRLSKKELLAMLGE